MCFLPRPRCSGGTPASGRRKFLPSRQAVGSRSVGPQQAARMAGDVSEGVPVRTSPQTRQSEAISRRCRTGGTRASVWSKSAFGRARPGTCGQESQSAAGTPAPYQQHSWPALRDFPRRLCDPAGPAWRGSPRGSPRSCSFSGASAGVTVVRNDYFTKLLNRSRPYSRYGALVDA